jgi:hypothetical protein
MQTTGVDFMKVEREGVKPQRLLNNSGTESVKSLKGENQGSRELGRPFTQIKIYCLLQLYSNVIVYSI